MGPHLTFEAPLSHGVEDRSETPPPPNFRAPLYFSVFCHFSLFALLH